jgi:Raf kinase inhibitor-like YbhB/YbcL family protein
MQIASIIAALALAATAGPAMAASTAGLAINDPGLKGAKTLKVTSPKIPSGGAIPDKYSSYGESVSPPLNWGKGPYGTRSFVLVLEDPDAPMATPFAHWVVWNIPAGVDHADEGAAPAGAQEGKLMYVNKTGYFGPRPPEGPAHHYHFQVFALDRPLELKTGADRDAVVVAMKGHVLASGELVATYQKK